MQVGKGAGDHTEDDAIIANIQFGGSKVRRLSESDDSSGGVDDAPQKEAEAKHSDKGTKGKGKMCASSNSSVAEGAHVFQSSRKSGELSSNTGDVHEENREAKENGMVDKATAAEAPRSLLVSGIEAQVRREAERAKSLAGSTGTKIVVKKKKRDKGGEATAGGDKKRKKHKSKEKIGGGSKRNKSVGAVAPAPAVVAPATAGGGVGGLGGLNLLGSYASSGSDGD